MLETPFLRAYNAVLAHTEEKYALQGLHMNSARSEKVAQPSGPFTWDGFRGVLEGKDCYGMDMAFPFI